MRAGSSVIPRSRASTLDSRYCAARRQTTCPSITYPDTCRRNARPRASGELGDRVIWAPWRAHTHDLGRPIAGPSFGPHRTCEAPRRRVDAGPSVRRHGPHASGGSGAISTDIVDLHARVLALWGVATGDRWARSRNQPGRPSVTSLRRPPRNRPRAARLSSARVPAGDDRSSCPRTSPHRLTPSEVQAIGAMVSSPEYRHVPTGTLAVLAQRLGRVSAPPSTWYRLVWKYGWRRPRVRVPPAKPEVGLRTRRPDEVWHIDTTVIRLLDATRAYLHAIIDNFSRRILAWRVADTFAPATSVVVLLEASRGTTHSASAPVVLADAAWRTSTPRSTN
jgi:hypothetical protein